MLTCGDCGDTSKGAAWHWIAVLMPTEGSDEATVAVYCPACAENRFKYFSERLRRSTLGEDL